MEHPLTEIQTAYTWEKIYKIRQERFEVSQNEEKKMAIQILKLIQTIAENDTIKPTWIASDSNFQEGDKRILGESFNIYDNNPTGHAYHATKGIQFKQNGIYIFCRAYNLHGNPSYRTEAVVIKWDIDNPPYYDKKTMIVFNRERNFNSDENFYFREVYSPWLFRELLSILKSKVETLSLRIILP